MTKAMTARAPSVPQAAARTIDGIEFYPSALSWKIPTAHGAVCFNFTNLPGASQEFCHQARDAFAALLLANAPERLVRLLSRTRGILKFLVTTDPTRVINQLTAADLENYGASLPNHQQYFLRQARDILVEWAKTGIGGLSHDLLLLLPTLETKHHEIGAAVLTMDPTSGPLTDIEYESVIAALRQAYASGEMSVSDYAMMALGISLGCRSMQLAMMKVKDLSIGRRSDGSRIYLLQVTRLKQGRNIRPRTLFKTRELAPPIGALLEQQIDIVTKWAANNGLDPDEAPLFPSTTKALHDSRVVLTGLKGHHNAKSASSKISELLSGLRVISARTGKEMELFQTRIRRTFGSRAAAEGLPAAVIAELMDHSWVDSSLVYIEARPEIMERIDKALALKVAPIAQAFAGTLMTRPEDLSEGNVRIIHLDTPERLEAVGGCGKFDFCGLAAPLACYTCAYFNPWLDGIHEALLERLLAEREELLTLTDIRIASVNDRTVLAVADVVNRCRTAAEKGAV
ncbi:site-specific integrase [Noviherbaspirillum galbum]|uniref:Site-specific integrase n=1 Tax=Noviherbaspirillum galbum TaxID=2709383 RepID=A0A6B3SHG3_9BURK|nr:site-specific integrase [Noviherbaspirillum galbum]NEX60093.1 site-specific integrase [Noviherbaspirillum galbum]